MDLDLLEKLLAASTGFEEIDIPELFTPLDSENYFTECLVCEKELVQSNSKYLINRGFSNQEPIYEYSACLECYVHKIIGRLSKESFRNIKSYQLENNISPEERERELWESCGTDIGCWLSHCMMTGKPMTDCTEYYISGQFRGEVMLINDMLYMVSDRWKEIMSNKLLSDKTLGFMDDFTSEYFLTPSESIETENPVFI